jgi:hypothetical protein
VANYSNDQQGLRRNAENGPPPTICKVSTSAIQVRSKSGTAFPSRKLPDVFGLTH